LWTYDGKTPGPEIRAKKGERIRIRFRNELPEPTSIHWHGIRIENAMDGVSGLTQEAVPPGGEFMYEFTVPDAGTYWYHAHNKSWNQVARGLYGSLIVDETDPAFDPNHDITLIIDDWRLGQDGTLDTASLGSMMDWSHGGRLGNWLTVNGNASAPVKLNKGQPYRLRLINVSNARVYTINPTKFGGKILAFDGQALSSAVSPQHGPLLFGPAQRIDLLVTPDGDFRIEDLSGDQPFSLVEFGVEGAGSVQSPVPALVPNTLPEPDLSAARDVRLEMTGGAMGRMGNIVYQGRSLTRQDFMLTKQVWAFNGVANLAEAPLFRTKRGETIVMEVINQTVWEHAMHVHGHHFRILDRSGSDMDEGHVWRDTFMIGPEQTTRIAFVADNPGKWLLHCHMLEHAAAGMNTWFEVA
ncbi:MAG: multicopper oxidase family protein, partial [Novosphingobium sp.]|nr:multicopper oxidase family protein [Novosphingobium sp.]